MVFQQRNGRIDRYGQTKKPDIRYFLIQSKNEKIKGDTRIMEILIKRKNKHIKILVILHYLWENSTLRKKSKKLQMLLKLIYLQKNLKTIR